MTASGCGEGKIHWHHVAITSKGKMAYPNTSSGVLLAMPTFSANFLHSKHCVKATGVQVMVLL